MSKVVPFAVKIEDDKRDLMREFCDKNGIKIYAFLGNAIKHEIERETMKEDLLIHEEYVKYGKKTATDYVDFAKKAGLKV